MPQIGCGYVRVSTEDQEEYSPDSQIKLLREYAKAHDILLPEEFIFRDDGISGRKADKRPEFMRMISLAKSDDKPFEVILVWKFSRFARNQEESIVYKSLLKNQHGVDVISVSEPLPEGPFGSLVERIIEWTDEYYSIRLSGEVRRGMTERVSRGEAVTIAPYGYQMDSGRLLPHPEESKIVQMIYNDFLSGMTMHAIADKTQDLGIKTKRGNYMANRTIRYLLTNPVYCGKLRWSPNGANNYAVSSGHSQDTMLVQGKHEAIIDADTFDAVQAKIELNLQWYASHNARWSQRQEPGRKGDFMLRGIVKCSACGSTLSRVKDGLQCCEYSHSICRTSHYVSMPLIEGMVLYAIGQQMDSLAFEVISKSNRQPIDGSEIILRNIAKEQGILKRIKDAYAAGIDTLDEYRENKMRVQNKINRLQQSLNALPAAKKIDKASFAAEHKKDLALLQDPNIDPTSKNKILRSFVDKIIFSRPSSSVSIVYYD